MWQEVLNLQNYKFYLTNSYAVSGLYNAVIAFLFSGFVYIKNRKNLTNITYGIFGFFVGVWCFCYFLWQISTTEKTALFWSRGLMSGAIYITVAYYHFITAYLNLVKKKKFSIVLGYLIFSIFSLLNFTPLFVQSVRPLLGFKFWPKAGILFGPFLAVWFFYAIYALYLTLRMYRASSGSLKNQARLILIGMFFAYACGSTNYLLWYDIKVLPVGNYFCVLAYMILTAYAIVRYRFMEIDTVIHRTVLWILTSGLVLIPIGVLLYFTRYWMHTLNWIQLTFVTTGLFYLFLYYYRKMQPRIDHLFRRRKYDYYTVLGEIGQKIGSELDINRVVNRLFKELKEILYIRNGLILVQQPGQLDYTEAGSIGYENLPATEKKEKSIVATLNYRVPLSTWLQAHQKVLEREQVEVDPQYSSIKEEALDFFIRNSLELLIPVVMEDRVNAIVGIGKKENLQTYTMKDVELLEHMGRQIGITIDNALHHEDIVEKERLAQELKLGREIQTSLLPQEPPNVPGLVVRGLMQPAKEIGGDYYDFITLPQKDELAVVIGDVSGKGVAAGLLMAMAKTAIHTLSQEETSPKQILLKTNQILHRHIGGQKFMTLLYLKWQYPNLSLAYSSAGHEHILIYRNQNQELEVIQSGGFMLGMIESIESFIEDKNVKLQSRDKILLYTDGVTEAENRAGERFGLEKLKEVFQKHGAKPANELMESIKDEVYAFIGSHPQYDDITLVVMEAE